MKDRNKTLAILLLALLGGLQISSTASSDPPSPGANPARVVTCGFSNPSYSGWCRATEDLPEGISSKAVCRSILGCLNDARCTKTYCNATQIRGGWKLESVDTGSKKN